MDRKGVIMNYCNCKDWKPQSSIIDGALGMDQIHSATAQNYDKFKIFRFCPWCGSKLKEEK